MTIWINRTLRAVEELDMRRVFRNGIGDWCAYIDAPDGEIHTAVFEVEHADGSLSIKFFAYFIECAEC